MKNFFVFFLYLSFALICVYPLEFHMQDSFPSVGLDSTQYLWNEWWMKKALSNFVFPFFSDYIYYPFGTGLIYNAFMPLRGIFSVPLQWFFGLIPSHNMLVMVNLVFIGYFMYLAAWELTKNKYAAGLSGLYLMLSPYIQGKIEIHQNLSDITFLPLFLYAITLFVQSQSKKSKFLFVGSLCALFFTDYYQFFQAFVLSLCVLIVIYKNVDSRKKFLQLWGITLFFLYPFFLLFAKDYGYYKYPVIFETEQLSLDPIRFFLPNDRSWFYHEIAYLIGFIAGREGEEPFLGLFPLTLVASMFFFLKKDIFWKMLGLGLLIALLFSNGPILLFNKQTYSFVPMPFSLLLEIPVVQNLRAPIRFMMLIVVLFAAFVGLSFNKASYYLTSFGKKIAFLFCALIISLEFISIPKTLEKVTISPFFYDLKKEKEDFAIWTVPTEFWEDQTRAVLAQTIHEKKVLGGFVSRPSQRIIDEYYKLPVISDMIFAQYDEDSLLSYSFEELKEKQEPASLYFKEKNIKYIVIYKNYPNRVYKNHLLKEVFLQFYPEKIPYYEDDQITVYKLF